MELEQKLKLAINALKQIRDWDDECEDLWDDPGACANETLNRLN